MKTRFVLFSYFTISLNLLCVHLGIFLPFISAGEWHWSMEKLWTAALRDIFALYVTQICACVLSTLPSLKSGWAVKKSGYFLRTPSCLLWVRKFKKGEKNLSQTCLTSIFSCGFPQGLWNVSVPSGAAAPALAGISHQQLCLKTWNWAFGTWRNRI